MIVPQSFQSVDLSNSLTYFLSKKQVDGLVHRKSTAVLHRLQMDWYLGKAQLSYTGCRRTGTWGKHSCSTQAADGLVPGESSCSTQAVDGLVPGESTAVLHRLQTDWYLGKPQLLYPGCRWTGAWGKHSCSTQAADGLVPVYFIVWFAGERLIRHRSDNLAIEVLINPQSQTVKDSLKAILTQLSPAKAIIYAGYAFQGTAAWVVQDELFTFAAFNQVGVAVGNPFLVGPAAAVLALAATTQLQTHDCHNSQGCNWPCTTHNSFRFTTPNEKWMLISSMLILSYLH